MKGYYPFFFFMAGAFMGLFVLQSFPMVAREVGVSLPLGLILTNMMTSFFMGVVWALLCIVWWDSRYMKTIFLQGVWGGISSSLVVSLVIVFQKRFLSETEEVLFILLLFVFSFLSLCFGVFLMKKVMDTEG